VTVRVGSCRIGGRVARTLAVARVEILHLIHDRTTISLILLVPAIQIVLFGYAVNLDPRHVPIAVAGDHGDRANQVSRVIGETGYFMIVADGLKPGAAERMVGQGKALVGIEMPPHEHSDRGAPLGEPQVVVDATDPAAVRPALAALDNAYWRHAGQLYAIGPVPSVRVEWLYNPDGRTAWTIVPGLAGVVVMISMLMLGALTLVRERERGSWETLTGHACRRRRCSGWETLTLRHHRYGSGSGRNRDRQVAVQFTGDR
jgi:ABC-2 type transport system permease protein